MALDLIALAILAFFGFVGALRGGVSSAMGLLTLVLSYAAAVWAAQNLGDTMTERLGTSPLFGPALAGTGGFLATAVVVGTLGSLVRRSVDRTRADSGLSSANRWLGGVFGLVRGTLVVVLISWLVIWLDAARQSGAFEGLAAVPDIQRSSAAKATQTVVEKTVAAALDDDASSDVVARLAARPGPAVRSLQEILADRRIEELQRDRFFWTLIENGAYDRALRRRSFQDIARSQDLRAKLADVGVIGPEEVADPRRFEERFGQVLAEVGPRLKGIMEDPDLARLAQDPEITSLLEAGDTLGLVRHEGIQRLVAKVSSRPTP
jgi:membrane protein required for colicin V production